ncbi:transposase [Colletotrichum orchidophilum]|uniref:Transposase n=1 Tax=Colletotrichum orchidophilum TaxID=1209926 RepID=A0A1G4B9N5_9PEZI|nr:transposase [Colletotrichum orchidophilum]OHE98099.1 transposase [Colletotrichum orchidophilum]
MKQYTEVDVSQTLGAMANGQSLKKASLELGVPRSTLQRRIRGAQLRDTAVSDQQRFSPTQEGHVTAS